MLTDSTGCGTGRFHVRPEIGDALAQLRPRAHEEDIAAPPGELFEIFTVRLGRALAQILPSPV